MRQAWCGGSYVKNGREKREDERRSLAWIAILDAHERQGHGYMTHFGPMPHDDRIPGGYCPRCGWVDLSSVWGRRT